MIPSDPKITISYASDDEHNHVYAELSCESRFLLAIVCEKKGEVEVEFPPDSKRQNAFIGRVTIGQFENAIAKAKAKLSSSFPSDSN
jgi:hypothetical protein